MPEGAAGQQNQRIYQFPMRVEVVRTRTARETEELLALARERAYEPSVFDTQPPYFLRAVVSNTHLDSYGTHQHESSLQNYAADLDSGIAFLANHNHYSLPMGQSLRGSFVRKRGENPTRTWGDFFLVPGLNLNGINTDDFIRGVQAGVVRDVSKGFWGGFWRCDLDGLDYMKYGWGQEGFCNHFLLEDYETEDGKRETCTVTVEDAHLSEVSAVFDGSVPGAAIEKAVAAIEAGVVPVEKARSLATRYRAALPGTEHFFPGWTPPSPRALPDDFIMARNPVPTDRSAVPDTNGKERSMADDPKATPSAPTDPGVLTAFWRSIGDALKETGFQPPDGKEPATVLREMASEITELRAQRDKVVELEQKVADLTPQAADGRTYRSDKINETWGEYVRAGLADGVDEAEQKALWSRAPIAQVVKECDHYRKLGDARFPGGRQTSEGEPEKNGRRDVDIPVEAFMTLRR